MRQRIVAFRPRDEVHTVNPRVLVRRPVLSVNCGSPSCSPVQFHWKAVETQVLLFLVPVRTSDGATTRSMAITNAINRSPHTHSRIAILAIKTLLPLNMVAG